MFEVLYVQVLKVRHSSVSNVSELREIGNRAKMLHQSVVLGVGEDIDNDGVYPSEQQLPGQMYTNSGFVNSLTMIEQVADNSCPSLFLQ